MKRSFLLIAVLAVCTSASAQSFWIGPKAGLSASWITHTNLDLGDKVVPHNFFDAGLFASYDFGEELMVQAELLYSGKGHTDRNMETDYKYSRHLSYLQMPLLVGYKFADERLHIMVGPELGYLLSSRTRSDDPGDRVGDTTDDCNRFNIALAIQFAYYFLPELGVDVKFDFGLNRTFKQDFSYGSFDDKGRNMSLQLGLCYRFEL